MRCRRLLLVAAALVAACEDSAAPPAVLRTVVRIEAATATALRGTVGTAVTPAPTVRALDEEGRPVAGVTVSFDAGSGGTIASAAVQTGPDGLATVESWILGRTTGNQSLTARVIGLAGVVFNATAEAGPVARIVPLSGNDQTGGASQTLLQPLRVRVTDSFDNRIAGSTVTFSVIAGQGNIQPAVAITDADGIATSGLWTLGPAVGVQQVRAEAGSVQTVFSAHAFAIDLWDVTGSMATPRFGHTATLLSDGRVLITGGTSSTGSPIPLPSAELYNPTTGAFVATGSMISARVFHSATLLPDGSVLIAGGSSQNAQLKSAEIYDPASGTFAATGDLLESQSWHQATLLGNGKVLIAVGFPGTDRFTARAALFDPAGGTFSATGAYASANPVAYNGLIGVTATLLPDGKVLFASEPRAELYDPVSGTFSLTGSMVTGGVGGPGYISGRTATLLTSGKVLLTGGHHEDFGRWADAELYERATGVFVSTGKMAYIRDLHTATLLASGRVLIAGGESIGPCDQTGCDIYSLNSSELYEPGTGTFSRTAALNVRREGHTATRLKDGRVLVTGGLTFVGGLNRRVSVTLLASAELYREQR